MHTLRIWFRLLAVVAVSGSVAAVWLLGAPLTLGSARALARWRTWAMRTWSRLLLPCLGVRVQVCGSPPQAPFILVSNHLGYLDILVLASQLHGTFVAQAGIAHWPAIGLLARWMGTLFIAREQKRDIPRVLACMEQTLDAGRGVIVFPEGTSSPGVRVEQFYPSLLEAAARSGRPVYSAALHYRTGPGDGPAYRDVCWWGGTPLTEHAIRLLAIRRITATVRFGAETVTDSDRKRLATRLHRAVSELFEPVAAAEQVGDQPRTSW